MKKRCLSILLALVMLLVGVLPAAAFEPTGVDISAEAGLLLDLDRDAVVFEKNADAKMYPASLTKIMTAVCVLDACETPAGVTIEAAYEALDPLYGTDSSVFGLSIGEEMTAYDLLALMMIMSANDAANVLAYHFGGNDIDAFIEKMNAKAKELGMNDTHFVNAHGLHDDDHYTTARDLCTLTKHALGKPLFKELVTSLSYEVPANYFHVEQIVKTTVYLQDPDEPDYYYEYAEGVKTGYTDPAGRCLITTAKKNGQRYLCVLLKCPVADADGYYIRKEFGLSKDLYEWAFGNLEYRVVNTTTDTVAEQKVEFGKNCETVALNLGSVVESIVEKSHNPSKAQLNIMLENDIVTAPIEKGQKLGTADILVDGKTVGTVDVVASTNVEKDNMKVMRAALRTFFSNPLVKTVLWILGILITLFALFIAYCFWCRARNRRRRKQRRDRIRRREEAQRRVEQQAKNNPYGLE